MKNSTFKFKEKQMVEVIAGEKRGVKAFVIFGVHREDGNLYKIGVSGEVNYQNEGELIKEEDLLLIKDEDGNYVERFEEVLHHYYRLAEGDTIKLPDGVIVKAIVSPLPCDGCCFNERSREGPEMIGCDYIPCEFTYKNVNLIFKKV